MSTEVEKKDQEKPTSGSITFSEDEEDAFEAFEDDDDEDDEEDEDYVPEKGNSGSDSDYDRKRKAKQVETTPCKRKRPNKGTPKLAKSIRKSKTRKESVALRRSSRSSRSGRVSYAEISDDDLCEEENSSDERKKEDKKKRVEELWSTFSDPPSKKRKSENSKEDKQEDKKERHDENGIEKAKEETRACENKEDDKNEDNGEKQEQQVENKNTKVDNSNVKEQKTEISESKSEEITVQKELKAEPPKKPYDAEVEITTKPGKSKGLAGVLGKMNDKGKISILDKSKVDWDDFKESEGIEEELKANRTSGFLDKQDFLHRVDYNQWENEREIRLFSNKK